MSHVDMLFKGFMGWPYFCAKSGNNYVLFRREIMNRQFFKAENSLIGREVDENSTLVGPNRSFEKGKFVELKLALYPKSPVFKPGAKVLALKPISPNNFTKRFFPAKIVSGPNICTRQNNDFGAVGSVRVDKTRHEYLVKFDGESDTKSVFEDFIVPVEKYWENELDVYNKDESDDSSSESDSSDSEESSTESEKEKKKHHKKSHKKRHEKKEKRIKKHKSHKNRHPNVVIIPIFIPYYQDPMYW